MASYDGEASFTLDISGGNVTEVWESTVNNIKQAMVKYKDEEEFIRRIKADPRYRNTFEHTDANGGTRTKLLMLSEKYYFTVDMHAGNENCATIKSLFANVSVPDVYPIFNSSVYVEFGMEDGVPYGGTRTFTIDGFNADGSMKMKDNAYKTYEELKAYYAEINSDLYKTDDLTETVCVKLYSRTILKNGTHYYDGYPVSIRFTEENAVEVSLDLQTLLAG